MAERKFERGRLLPQHELRELELCPALTARIPAKLTHTLICALSNVLPLDSLKHLKRVCKAADQPAALDIIICEAELTQKVLSHIDQANGSTTAHATSQAEDTGAAQRSTQHAADAVPSTIPTSEQLVSAAQQALPAAAVALVTAHGLPLQVQLVPAQPPQTRRQWEAWGSAHWPMAWKIPEGSEPPTGDALLATNADQAYFEQHLTALLDKVAAAAAEAGGTAPRNAARIVDPASRAVVAEGCDCRHAHPLHHAAMVAIEAAAARDLTLWPPDSAGAQIDSTTIARETSTGPRHSIAPHSGSGKHTQAQQQGGTIQAARALEQSGSTHTDTSPHDPACKRQRTGAKHAHTQHRDGTTGCHEQTECMGNSATVHRTRSSEQAGAHSAVGPRPYMCTGYDCFLVSEPCVMCAMALVHSRVSRVVFCGRDEKGGALGGSFHLMKQRSLNHHYQVYHVACLE